MVPGVPGKSGPHVPKPVVKEPQKESGAVPLLFQPMVEQTARGNLPSQRPVTKNNVSQLSSKGNIFVFFFPF